MNQESNGPTDLEADVVAKLRELNIDLSELCIGDAESGVKVVCVPASLQGSLSALGGSPREHVVMVRVDTDTMNKLDAWVETGAVRSRSEAAALFLREGLGIRDGELEELGGALKDLAEAKQRLRQQAEHVLGSG